MGVQRPREGHVVRKQVCEMVDWMAVREGLRAPVAMRKRMEVREKLNSRRFLHARFRPLIDIYP